MARFIPVVGLPRDVQPANGVAFSLRELQTFVGGYIEITKVYLSVDDDADDEVMFMVLNEEGKLRGLPRNETATILTRHAIAQADWIAGDVLLCSLAEMEGDE